MKETAANKFEVGQRIYHRRADLFGTIVSFTIGEAGEAAWLKYEYPHDGSKPSHPTPVFELVPDYDAPVGE